jgi:predicted double-glycine peptidase
MIYFLNIQNYNFACGSVWVWNLVSNIKGEPETEGVW